MNGFNTAIFKFGWLKSLYIFESCFVQCMTQIPN